MKLAILGGGGFRVPLVYRALLDEHGRLAGPGTGRDEHLAFRRDGCLLLRAVWGIAGEIAGRLPVGFVLVDAADVEAGHDVVNTYRENRQDSWWRLQVSKWHNKIRALMMPKLEMQDEGCMLRAYRRNIVDLMSATGESTTYGDGTGENAARIAHEKEGACCVPQQAGKPASKCC